jgi:tRNA 2-thiouridine synthesizing protein C
MKSIFYLLNSAPYGSEKAFGLLNAAAVSIKMNVAVGFFGDGVYLALAGQNSRALNVPNLSDLVYAYTEIKFLAHELSIAERGLINQSLIESVDLMDEEKFLEEISRYESIILL